MAHMHKQIRDALQTLLTNLATTGTNVYPQHVYAVPEGASLPGLGIFALEEDIILSAMGNVPIYERMLSLSVQGVSQSAAKGPSDELAQIALEVEQAIAGDPTLGGLVITITLEKIEYVFTGEGAKPSGSIDMTFVAEYRTTSTDPETSV